MTTSATPAGTRPEDERPPLPQLVGYGLQHILSMVGGVIAVPFIVAGAARLSPGDTALLVSAALFVSGAATVLQTVGVPLVGSRLPLVQGISFASVSTMVTIVAGAGTGQRGLRLVFGAVIVAAVVGLVVAPAFSRVVRLFPPVVSGSVITVIGLSLLPVAGGWITGQQPTASRTSLVLAGVTLLLVLVLSRSALLSRLAILLSLVAGTAIAALAGETTWTGADADLAALPTPFAFGTPLFDAGAIVSMTVVVLVIMVETTADLLAVGEIVGTPVDNRRIAAGLRADMLSSAVAPLFNSFPATAFAQNVGLVAVTGVRSRYAVAVGGGVLAVLGLSPLLASVVALMPLAVLAGAGIVLFGSVTASGIRTLGRVDYAGTDNLLIVATSIGVGMLPLAWPRFWDAFPDWWQTVFGSEISATAIVAFVLNLVLNVIRPRRAPEAAR